MTPADKHYTRKFMLSQLSRTSRETSPDLLTQSLLLPHLLCQQHQQIFLRSKISPAVFRISPLRKMSPLWSLHTLYLGNIKGTARGTALIKLFNKTLQKKPIKKNLLCNNRITKRGKDNGIRPLKVRAPSTKMGGIGSPLRRVVISLWSVYPTHCQPRNTQAFTIQHCQPTAEIPATIQPNRQNLGNPWILTNACQVVSA